MKGERKLEKQRRGGSREDGNRKKVRAADEEVARRLNVKCYAVIKRNGVAEGSLKLFK